MRSHLLEDLELTGRDQVLRKLPGFDFYNLCKVERLEWTSGVSNDDPNSATLTLVAQYDDGRGDSLLLKLHCIGVRMVKLPALSGLFTINELEIEDLFSSQLEGIRWRLKDYFESDLEILCQELALAIVPTTT